jgi:hypothetical protein
MSTAARSWWGSISGSRSEEVEMREVSMVEEVEVGESVKCRVGERRA